MEFLDNFLVDLIKDIPKTDLTNFFGLFKKVKIKKMKYILVKESNT